MTTYQGERMKDSFLTLIAITPAGRAPLTPARNAAPPGAVMGPAGNGVLAAASILHDHALMTLKESPERARALAAHQARAFFEHFIKHLPFDKPLVVTSTDIDDWLAKAKETKA